MWRRDKVQLYRYHSPGATLGPPILLVMSLVSKPYVLDLRPGNSFVEALVGRGFDVYMIDWGTPDAADADNSFETYCDEYIPFACAAAMRTSGADELHVFGYCFGGVLSLIFAAGHPEIPLRTLSLMATPIDFAAMGGMTTVFRDRRVDLSRLPRRDRQRPRRRRAARPHVGEAHRRRERCTPRCSRSSRTATTSRPTRRCTAGRPTTSRSRASASARPPSG